MKVKKQLLGNLQIEYERNLALITKLNSQIQNQTTSPKNLVKNNSKNDLKLIKEKLKIEKEDYYFNKQLLDSLNVKIKNQKDTIEKIENRLEGYKTKIEKINQGTEKIKFDFKGDVIYYNKM